MNNKLVKFTAMDPVGCEVKLHLIWYRICCRYHALGTVRVKFQESFIPCWITHTDCITKSNKVDLKSNS